LRRVSILRQYDNCDRRKAKQNADYNAEFKECRSRSGFLFHGI
jgi:hypothetical protein